MGPLYLIGALLLLIATAGDSTNQVTPQQHHQYQHTNHAAITNQGSSSSSSVQQPFHNKNINNPLNGIGGLSIGEGPISQLNAIIEEPEFTELIENVTVPAGRNVKLGCSVKNLGSYKVAWMHFEQSAILTVHNHVITRNPRISVTHDKHDRHRTWYLHINNVHQEDKGRYMCQINTVSAKTQFGYLEVVVPPNIDDSLSSSDVIVREGTNISLRCRATGSPTPMVKWKRDDNSKIAINKNYIVSEWEGDTLDIMKISRLDMGAYLCIASNGVPPTVSKRIKVSVDFPPMLLIPHQLVGAPECFNVTIECFTEAHPTSLNYWTRGEGPIIHDSIKYKVESTIGEPAYKTHMKLTILSVTSGDDGMYKCVAKNPRGETDGIIRLYVSNPPTTVQGIITTGDWDMMQFGNSHIPKSVYNTNEKNTKYSSNQNDITLTDQKISTNLDNKITNNGYGWSASQDDNTNTNSNLRRNISIKLYQINIYKFYGIICIFNWILKRIYNRI